MGACTYSCQSPAQSPAHYFYLRASLPAHLRAFLLPLCCFLLSTNTTQYYYYYYSVLILLLLPRCDEYVWPHVKEVSKISSREIPPEHLEQMARFLQGYDGILNFNYKVRPGGETCV